MTLQFKNPENCKLLKLDKEMEIEIPSKIGLLDFAGQQWEIRIEGKMKMRLNHETFEIEIKSTGIKGVYGTGFLWKVSDLFYDVVTTFTVTKVVDGEVMREPNAKPEPYYVTPTEFMNQDF